MDGYGIYGQEVSSFIKKQLPGLAMSRSFGDVVAASVGVLSEPDITVHYLDDFINSLL
jgi:Protein phosphatase 2C